MIKINKEICFLFILKFLYSLFALYIYSGFTPLGDTPRYWAGPQFGQLSGLYNSTAMMDNITRIFFMMGGPIFANIPFIALSTFGIYYPLRKSRFTQSYRFLIYLFLLTPSIGIWTSIASKEAMSVFFMGIILGNLIEYLRIGYIQDKKLFLLSLYLAALFKPQYFAPLTCIFSFVYLSRTMNLKNSGLTILFLFYIFMSGLIIFLFRDLINELSFIIPQHFSLEGGSTRDNPWIVENDFFKVMPMGMLVAFWGPTLSESLESIKFMFSFLESCILTSFLILPYVIFTSQVLSRKKIYLMPIFIIALFTFWILFVNYPFGYLNIGSAIRYRSNFLPFLVILVAFLIFHSQLNHASNNART